MLIIVMLFVTAAPGLYNSLSAGARMSRDWVARKRRKSTGSHTRPAFHAVHPADRAVVGVAVSQVEVDLLGELHIAGQRHDRFDIAFRHVEGARIRRVVAGEESASSGDLIRGDLFLFIAVFNARGNGDRARPGGEQLAAQIRSRTSSVRRSLLRADHPGSNRARRAMCCLRRRD